MSVSKKTVELFYDVISPYTWFAFEVLNRYKNRWSMDLKMKPFFLGGIMAGSDNKPPAMVPNKSIWMMRDLKLLSKYFDVPLKLPKDPAEVMFTKGTLSAQRFITAVDMADKSLTEEVSRQLWMRAWSRDEDISQPESFIQAGQAAGLSEEQIISAVNRIKDQGVKDRLKQYTDEALKYGAFGSPTIIAHVGTKPVMLFGSDRFPILAQVLGEKWEGPSPGTDSKL